LYFDDEGGGGGGEFRMTLDCRLSGGVNGVKAGLGTGVGGRN